MDERIPHICLKWLPLQGGFILRHPFLVPEFAVSSPYNGIRGEGADECKKVWSSSITTSLFLRGGGGCK
jgi:hypothetical protein